MNTRPETPIVVSEGDAYERGFHLGQTVSDRVHRTVDAYFGLFHYHAGLDRERVLSEAERFVPVIDGYAPDLLTEMRGIADGAGCDSREIVAINARTELLHGVSQAHECTSFAVNAEASADGHVRIGQNWDWYAWLAGTPVLWVIRRADEPDVLTFTEAGMVGKIGVNASGFAVCVNLLKSDADHPGPAVPMHVMLRHLLDSVETVDEAVAHIIATPRCTSANHLLADRTGAIADVEATPAGCYVIEPEDGVITHTNHCVDAELFELDRGAREEPETIARGDRAAELATGAVLTEEAVRELLADHGTAPNSICFHVRPEKPEAEQGESVASLLFDLTAGTLDIADGPPCSFDYRRIELDRYLREPVSVLRPTPA